MSKILLLYTGGTIGMERDYESNTLKPFDFNNIQKQIPELNQIQAEIDVLSFKEPLDSSDIKPSHWVEIVKTIQFQYKNYDGFVILHGTDTMAYSASAVSFMLRGLKKPVIFTGSQLPVGDLRTDAKENLITSLHFASLKKENKMQVQEVCIYFEFKLFRANRTTKINAENFDAFSSPNYPIIGKSGIYLELEDKFLFQTQEKQLVVETEINTNVGLVKIFPGINQSFLECMFNAPDLEAIIIEAFGSGNVFTDSWFTKLLESKIKQDIKVIIKTQCAGGMVELGRYQTSEALKNMGAISGRDLTTEAAIAKAIWLLPKKLTYTQFKEEYQKNLVGELL